jgi:hypothetical protein
MNKIIMHMIVISCFMLIACSVIYADDPPPQCVADHQACVDTCNLVHHYCCDSTELSFLQCSQRAYNTRTECNTTAQWFFYVCLMNNPYQYCEDGLMLMELMCENDYDQSMGICYVARINGLDACDGMLSQCITNCPNCP